MSYKENQTFIIAELSANHNNDLDLAIKTVKAIAESGADAVKVQTFTPDSLTLNVDNEYFGPRTTGLWKGRRLYDLYTEGSLPYEWHHVLKQEAEKNNLVFFSSPFSFKDVDFLETLQVPLYKIASPEITDIPLISYVASKGKPVIISTGMASFEDIELAVQTCYLAGNHNVTLLKCTSEYPASIDMANLLTLPDLKNRFKTRVGVSDHTMGSTVPVVSVSLGGTVIEKHFILDRSFGGIDSAFSMEPEEFKKMVQQVREAELALGVVSYELDESKILRRRSLFASKEIQKGEELTTENIKSVRPGHGLHPQYFNQVIGKKASQNIAEGTPLDFSLFL